jgi:hypothetical protein
VSNLTQLRSQCSEGHYERERCETKLQVKLLQFVVAKCRVRTIVITNNMEQIVLSRSFNRSKAKKQSVFWDDDEEERRFLLTGAMCRQKTKAARRPEDDEASAGKRKGRGPKKREERPEHTRQLHGEEETPRMRLRTEHLPHAWWPLFLSKPRRASRSRSCLRGRVTLGPYGTKTDLATFGPSRHLGPRYWTWNCMKAPGRLEFSWLICCASFFFF